ncbi:hypothetical protein C9374_009482 [Naegleria lovaniensis]|uniref:F-box domain-containing protein n=1 Tax=Naegleria lovaniensis TaxID=51637 RepID=A0AA88KWX6_NAELO|nr:uncharacterized protein C9374_009482 [Naegleria lovaniensis]KAG2392905.1 hypothetical protein C9374_009482 [Naegleria lovaniensis]
MGQHQVSSITHSDEVQDMKASSSVPLNRRTIRTAASSPRGGGVTKQQQGADSTTPISTFRSSMPPTSDINPSVGSAGGKTSSLPIHQANNTMAATSLPSSSSSSRRTQKSKGKLGAGNLLATSFSRRHFNDDLIGDEEESEDETYDENYDGTIDNNPHHADDIEHDGNGEESLRRKLRSSHRSGRDMIFASALSTTTSLHNLLQDPTTARNEDLVNTHEFHNKNQQRNMTLTAHTSSQPLLSQHHSQRHTVHVSNHAITMDGINHLTNTTMYPKTHYSYYWRPNVYKDCFMPTTSRSSTAYQFRKQTNSDLYASLATDDNSQCLEWTIRLDPENDPQFYELAFSLFHFGKQDDEHDDAVIPTSHSTDDDQHADDSKLAFSTVHITTATSPQNIHTSNHTSPKKNHHRENGVTSPQSLTATTPNSDAPTSVPSSLLMGSCTTTTTTSSTTTMGTDSSSIGLGTSSSTYLNIPSPSPSYHRPRGRAFLIGSQTSSSPNPHTSINSSSSNHFYPFESDRNSRDIASSPLLNSGGINHLHVHNQSSRLSSNSNIYLGEKRRKSLERTSRDYRREMYLQVLRTRFENRGVIPKEDDVHNKKRQQPSYYISASQLEQRVPFEIMFQILTYLTPDDLIKLGNVSRTFRYIWTEHPLLWVRYPYIITNENGDLNLGEMVEQEKSRIGSSFIDHASLRELIEESPFTTEKTNIVLSSWSNIYRAIYLGYSKGPWNNYCTFYNNVNTQSVEYRLSMIEIKVCLVGGSGTGKSSWVLMLKDANNGETPEIYKSRSKKIEYMEATIGASYTVKHIKVTLPHSASSSNDSQDDDSISSETDSYIMNRFVPIISESIWDTSGVKRYFPLIPLYLKTCKGIILCFDLNRPESFDEMIEIFEEYIFKQQANKCETMDLYENKHLFEKSLQEQDTYVYVCGMKCDTERHVSNDRITQFLHKYGGSRIKIFTNNFLYFELSPLTGENVYTPWLHLAYCVALNNQNDHA